MGLGDIHSCQEVGWHHCALGSSEKSSLFSFCLEGDLMWGGLQAPSPDPLKGDDSVMKTVFTPPHTEPGVMSLFSFIFQNA